MIFLLLLFWTTSGSHYKVPSYYGYWNRNFYLYQNITQGKLRLFEMHGLVDAEPNSQVVYVADPVHHVIRVANITASTSDVLSGTIDRAGHRVGFRTNALYNGSRGVAYYCENDVLSQLESSLRVVIAKDSSCRIENSNCIIQPTDTEPLNITPNNIRFVDVLGIDQTQTYRKVAQVACPPTSRQYLFISDTENSCIKRRDLRIGLTSVVAGRCRHSGFQDGPQHFNLLSKPTNLGVTSAGEVVFFDSGNEYIRVLFPNGTVATLLNGACTQYPSSRQIQTYEIRMTLCYLDWLETATAATNSHAFNAQGTTGTCTGHYSDCV